MLDIYFEDSIEGIEDINSDTSLYVSYRVCAVDESKRKGFWYTDADEFINEFGDVVFYLLDLTELDLGE